VPWLIEQAQAVLAAWFPGSEAGHAIADIVTGRVSPSGRTPVSWPRDVGQVPIFFGDRPSGRPFDAADRFTSKYLDIPNDPLFPFGFGLSYGRFAYSNLRVSPGTAAEHHTLEIRVDVSNVGSRESQETVFLFTRDALACISRPLLELKGFAKINLSPGESGTVSMSLKCSELRFLGADLESVFEPGDVEILVGPCAERAQLLAATIRLMAD
jgi:beta-glucosidase